MTENKIFKEEFEGERPLFGVHDREFDSIVIHAGESALKHVNRLRFKDCTFEGKYPLWHSENIAVNRCFFDEGSRAAIWYAKNVTFDSTRVCAPKMFRECETVRLFSSTFSNMKEGFWNCHDIEAKDVEMTEGDYAFMGSENIRLENVKITGGYIFQYCKNIELHHCELHSRDSFWHSENVTVYDSVVDGDYLAWHSHNVTLINCRVLGLQPFCYAHRLKLDRCTIDAKSEFCFEYSDVEAHILGPVTSIRNPASGLISVQSVGEIIHDEFERPGSDCRIVVRGP